MIRGQKERMRRLLGEPEGGKMECLAGGGERATFSGGGGGGEGVSVKL